MPKNVKTVAVKRGAKSKRESKLARTKGAGRAPVDKTVAATADALASTFCGLPGAISMGASDSLSLVQTASIRVKVPLWAQYINPTGGSGPVLVQPWLQINPGFFTLSGSFDQGLSSAGLLPGVSFVQQLYVADSADPGQIDYYIDSSYAQSDSSLADFLSSLAVEADAFRVAGCSVEVVPTDNAIFRSGTYCVKMTSTQRSPNQSGSPGTPEYWPEDQRYSADTSFNGFSVGGVMPFPADTNGAGNPTVAGAVAAANPNFDAVAPISIPATNDQAGYSVIVPPNFSPHDLFPTAGSDQAIPATDIILMAETWPTLNIMGDSFLLSSIEAGVIQPPALGATTTFTVANVWINVAVEYIATPSSLAAYTVIERPIPKAAVDEIVEGVQALRYAGGGTGLLVKGGMDRLSAHVRKALMDTAKSVLPKAAAMLPKVAKSVMDKFLPGASDVMSAGSKIISSLF